MLIPAYATLAVMLANMYSAGKAVTSGSVDTKPGKFFPPLCPLLSLPDSDQHFAVYQNKTHSMTRRPSPAAYSGDRGGTCRSLLEYLGTQGR